MVLKALGLASHAVTYITHEDAGFLMINLSIANSSSSALSYVQDAGNNRSATLETHLHSVKVKKRLFMQGMWDVAFTSQISGAAELGIAKDMQQRGAAS